MVLEKVIDIIAEELSVDPSEITEDSNLVEDLDADSLAVVDLELFMYKYLWYKLHRIVQGKKKRTFFSVFLNKILGGPHKDGCRSCFSGKFPV